jgi:RNA polymerase sigma-70 factor, ECF subfamily
MPQRTQSVTNSLPFREHEVEVVLIKRIIAGDGDAFEELITPYLGLFSNGIQRVLKNELDTQDALQAAMIHIHQGLTQFRAESKFSTWAYRICINEALMIRRSRLRRRENGFHEFPENLLESGGFFHSDIHQEWSHHTISFVSLEKDQFWSMLHQGMSRLGALQREVFVLRDLQGMTTEEVAQRLNISSGLVRQRLHRARRELRGTMSVFRATDSSKVSPLASEAFFDEAPEDIAAIPMAG